MRRTAVEAQAVGDAEDLPVATASFEGLALTTAEVPTPANILDTPQRVLKHFKDS